MIETMKKMTKPFAALLVLALAAGMGSSFAAGTPARAVRDADGKGVINLEYVGARECRVAGSTTASLCSRAGASGLLYQLCVFGTSAVQGKGAMAFDSASVAGLTTFDVLDTFVAAYAISPVVYGSALVVGSGMQAMYSVMSCWNPAVPARYESGFVMRLNDTSLMAIGLVRPDTGVNP